MELALTICAVIILLQGAAIIFITKSKKLNPNERQYLIEVVAQRDRLVAYKDEIIRILEETDLIIAESDKKKAERKAAGTDEQMLKEMAKIYGIQIEIKI